MISTTLMILVGAMGVAIVAARMMRKPHRGLSASVDAEAANWRDLTFAGMLLNVAAAIGLVRAQAEQSGDGNPGHGWHGSHLDHSPHADGGGFSDGGGGFGGSDGGGGGGL